MTDFLVRDEAVSGANAIEIVGRMVFKMKDPRGGGGCTPHKLSDMITRVLKGVIAVCDRRGGG